MIKKIMKAIERKLEKIEVRAKARTLKDKLDWIESEIMKDMKERPLGGIHFYGGAVSKSYKYIARATELVVMWDVENKKFYVEAYRERANVVQGGSYEWFKKLSQKDVVRCLRPEEYQASLVNFDKEIRKELSYLILPPKSERIKKVKKKWKYVAVIETNSSHWLLTRCWSGKINNIPYCDLVLYEIKGLLKEKLNISEETAEEIIHAKLSNDEIENIKAEIVLTSLGK